MGMPKEPTIFAEVNKVAKCTGVNITPGGASWLHAVVQIEKQSEADGRSAIATPTNGSLSPIYTLSKERAAQNRPHVQGE